MTLDEIKKLLEEMYEMRLRWNELEPGENPYEVVEVIEEIYSNIFGSDEFDEFIKRKEDEEEQLKSEILEKFKVLGDSITPLDYEDSDDYEREEEKLREEQENWEYEETQRFKWEHEKMEEEQEFLKRFDSGETFDEEELRDIVKEEIFDIVDTQPSSDLHRWTRTVTTVFEVEGRLFALEWEQGLTEECEDEFYDQPYEVEKKEKTVKVVEYVRKG